VCTRHGAKVKNAAVKDVQTMLKMEECAKDMVQRSDDAVAKDAQMLGLIVVKQGVCIRHGAKVESKR